MLSVHTGKIKKQLCVTKRYFVVLKNNTVYSSSHDKYDVKESYIDNKTNKNKLNWKNWKNATVAITEIYQTLLMSESRPPEKQPTQFPQSLG